MQSSTRSGSAATIWTPSKSSIPWVPACTASIDMPPSLGQPGKQRPRRPGRPNKRDAGTTLLRTPRSSRPVWLSDPAAAAGAQVKADQAQSPVVAGGDVAVGDAAAIDVAGVDERARDGRATGPHRR